MNEKSSSESQTDARGEVRPAKKERKAKTRRAIGTHFSRGSHIRNGVSQRLCILLIMTVVGGAVRLAVFVHLHTSSDTDAN